MIRLGILGSSGKMGKSVLELAQSEFKNHFTVSAAPLRSDPKAFELLCQTDLVIDFSTPAASTLLAETIVRDSKGPKWVCGTTGFSLEERKKLEQAAAKTLVLLSSNFSLGVMAFIHTLKTAGPLLDQLRYQPSIIETHHAKKKDAPSGTALSLQRAIAPAGPGNIQTLSVRAGDVVGTHEVHFFGPGEELVFSHRATDRRIFARGALKAAQWLAESAASTQKLLSMEDFFKTQLHQLTPSTQLKG